MKLKVKKQDVLAAMAKVQAVVAPRPTLPVLANILFRAENGQLWLAATDLDVSVRATVPAEVIRGGATTLPARHVVGIFRDAPGEEIEVEVGEREVATIRSGGAHFKLNGISADDFPPLPAFEAARSFSISRRVLKHMLIRTAYAASSDAGRQALTGVLLSFKAGKLTVVATDGRRLALVEQEVEFPASAEADIIVPAKTVSELIRSLGDEDTPLQIAATANQISFDAGEAVISSKITEGSYPNYRQVIPAKSEVTLTIAREPLLNAVRRVALLTSDQSYSVKLTFGKKKLDVQASTPEVGEAREQVDLDYKGKDIAISFNPDYLIEPLKNLVSDTIQFHLTDDMSPGVIQSEDPFLYVIMPLRLS